MQVLSAHVRGVQTPEMVSCAGTWFCGDILPFAINSAGPRLLRVVVLCMCKCMCMCRCKCVCSAGAASGDVCTRCRFLHVSIATSGKVILYETVIMYIVISLYHCFF